jgi:hypothetical protein
MKIQGKNQAERGILKGFGEGKPVNPAHRKAPM